MTNYLTWMQENQGSVLPMQGNPVASAINPTSGVATAKAPVGAAYALCWSDVPTKIKGDVLAPRANSVNLGNDEFVSIPANQLYEVVNVIAGVTAITMTDV